MLALEYNQISGNGGITSISNQLKIFLVVEIGREIVSQTTLTHI